MTTRGMLELIERKKRGGELDPEEIAWLTREYLRGGLPDYQVAAWLMAVRFRGMSRAETLALTRALVGSGESLSWASDRPVVDKHSTGGVGDKTSIVLVPLLASAGLLFVKMSGRGLGHTGGTLDKLESIPGFRVELTLEEVRAQVERIGCALISQTPELVPADGALYALRDATATVDSVPLIASSVMAKKLACGAPSIVLDVKYGAGAFMEGLEEARELATSMVEIGTDAGRRVRALLSPMDAPLGGAVGNALEVREAIATLQGGGPPDLRALTIELGAHLMRMAGAANTLEDARVALDVLLTGGLGADHLEKLIRAQGGDPRVVAHPDRLPRAPEVGTLEARRHGWVERVDARAIAEVVLRLGAGRQRKGDRVDSRTGVVVRVRAGERIDRGQPLAEIHAGTGSALAEAEARLGAAFRISPEAIAPSETEPIVIGA